jgi:flagellar motor switch protein FliG
MPSAVEKHMSGLAKAAVLATVLGPEKTADAIEKSGLEEVQVERLATEVARMESVDDEAVRLVVGEVQRASVDDQASAVGLVAAEELLKRALGAEKAAEIMPWVRPRRSAKLFASLAHADTLQLVRVLRDEQPLVIAVVLRHLPRRKAGEILSGLPEETRMGVVMRLVKPGGDPLRDALREMETALTRKMAVVRKGTAADEEEEDAAASGPRTLIEVLNNAELSVEKSVLGALGEQEPELAQRVRESMFIFDDLPRLESRALQTALRGVEASDLAMALKGSPDELKQVIYENLSENAAAGLKEDLESLGPVRRREVYAGQEKVVMAVRSLVEDGTIDLRAGTGEEDDQGGGDELDELIE